MDDNPTLDGTEGPKTLLADLERLQGSYCKDCDNSICNHEVLMSIVMGFKDSPLCLSCLAKGLEIQNDELRDQLYQHILRRDCWHEGWNWSNYQEGFTAGVKPDCLWGEPVKVQSEEKDGISITQNSNMVEYNEEWDAGDMSCGDLVLQLRIKLNKAQPGTVLKLTATDSGAPEDIPAWCQLTGNKLLGNEHPVYFIKRKE